MESKVEQILTARNEKGQFKECSPYTKKPLTVRLLKKDDQNLKTLAAKRGLTTTELARIAIAEWLKQNEVS